MAVQLFIGNLEESVGPKDLRSLFGSLGKIASIRVRRDETTGRSLGHGYINFEESADAQRAIESMSSRQLMGKPIQIAWSWRDPAIEKQENANLFVKGLKPEINAECLYKTFLVFGDLISCKVARNEQGVSIGYGYVQFQRVQDAESCIKKLNGMTILGKTIFISKFISKKDRLTNLDKKDNFTNIYVKNLPAEFQDSDLNTIFEVYGDITSLKIIRRENGYSKRFGFINYRKPEDAIKAVEHVNGTTSPSGKKYYVSRAQPKTEREVLLKKQFGNKDRGIDPPNLVNLFVKNLDGTVNDQQLKEQFKAFGVITSAKVMKENGKSMGFGFVCFEKPEQASAAIAHKNGSIINNNVVYVALAEKKANRVRSQSAKSVIAEYAKPAASGDVSSTYRATNIPHPGPTTGCGSLFYASGDVSSPYRATNIPRPGPNTGSGSSFYASGDVSSTYRATNIPHPGPTTGCGSLFYASGDVSSPYRATNIPRPGPNTGSGSSFYASGDVSSTYRATNIPHPGPTTGCGSSFYASGDVSSTYRATNIPHPGPTTGCGSLFYASGDVSSTYRATYIPHPGPTTGCGSSFYASGDVSSLYRASDFQYPDIETIIWD